MKKVLLILVLGSPSCFLFSQKLEATTNEGKKVFLKADGTWEYVSIPDKVEPSPSSKALDCVYKKNEIDDFSGDKIQILSEQDFIKQDIVKCQVGAAKFGKNKVLYFYWRISSKDAYKYYGSIEKGSNISIKLQNSETLTLVFSEYNSGDTNFSFGYTTYVSYAFLDDEIISKLKTSSIDKVRMNWSKGYQDYSILDPLLLTRQIPCIE
jgi:hypothetical protein